MVARTKDSTDATDAGTWLSTDMEEQLRWSKRQAKAISWYPFMLLLFFDFQSWYPDGA
ncbi:hypothetical protein GQ55_9G467800 [Panicum hallii var. hallii]|uniref:Uncharacterized protein n=2 Tax=Panicum hallii TaxID=206008 RepID=A0A2T7CCE3_9POAL|nr:hypothetical protein GQ55_9G467800 [Panicum hallii var. hallii]